MAEKWRGWAQWVKRQGKRYSGLKGVYRGSAGKISTAVVKKERKRVLKLKGVFAKNERGYRLNAIKKRF